MMVRGFATALVGAQYGSEGKGLVVSAMAELFDCHVRTGGPNAGHTYYHEGEVFVGRSIPCGWTNPEALLLIGPGAVLDLGVFQEELAYIQRYGDKDVAERLAIDPRAVIISRSQHLGEGGVDGRAHREIGSTGEGVGLARMSRINRDTLVATDTPPYACVRVADRAEHFLALGVDVVDTAAMLHKELATGSHVLLEGTQGSGLSLTLGPWPYCTSADTNAAQLASDAGISPSDVRETVLVARTFPIRVAGTSGPLADESTWEELGFQPEITTVTRKIRRVGRWNAEQVRYAAQVNHPARIVVTFLDYLFPETAGVTDWRELSDKALEWLAAQAQLIGADIIGAGTGPRSYCPLAAGVLP